MATGPWSVKGIDPRAREAAKAAAQSEGLTLGEWMNQRLLNESAPRPRRRSLERARFTAPGSLSIVSSDEPPADVQDAIEDLTARLEAAERRSTLAITGIDQTVLGMLTRLEGVEKTHEVTTDKLVASLDTLETISEKSRSEIDRMVSKVDRATEDSARRIDTVAEQTDLQLSRARHELSKELELVNNRSDELSQRLGAAERMTDNAVRTLEASFASLDERLRRTENTLNENGTAGLSETFNRRFKALGEELIQVVAQTRGQLASQIEAQSVSPRLEQYEASLRNVRSHIEKSERRHADTLERIASEVGKLGGAIDQRFSNAERNTAISLDKMLDARFHEFQSDHATAIDKIGDGLTGAISRLEEKLNTVEEKRSVEETLEARMLASEERTAKMVEEALARIQERLDAPTVREEVDGNSPVQKAMETLASRLEVLESTQDSPPPFDPTLHKAPAHTETPAFEEQAHPQDFNPALEEVMHPRRDYGEQAAPSLPPLALEDEDTADMAMDGLPGTEEHSIFQNPQDQIISPVYMPHEAEQYTQVGATADARFMAAARRSVRTPGSENGQVYNKAKPPKSGMQKMLVAGSLVAIIAIVGAGSVTLLDSFKGDRAAGPVRAADNRSTPGIQNNASATQDAVMANAENTAMPHDSLLDGAKTPQLEGAKPVPSSVQAEVKPQTSSKPAKRVAARPVKRATQRPPVRTARQTPPAPAPQNSITRAPKPQPTTPVSAQPLVQASTKTSAPVPQQAISTTGRLTIQQAAANGDPIAQFQLASAKLDAGAGPEGLALMKKSAQRGLPIAQYRLAKLYEEGVVVPKDEKAARQWTERAANGGNRRAMHNLAMLYAEGNSVPQSYDTAAKWFQEAARMGLTNSQYNLAFLYQQGLGVPESLAQAYAWYSIAAKAGDKGAKKQADEIGATLQPTAKKEANTLIANFRPRPLDLAANGIFRNVSWARPQLNTAPSIARAQVLLARLGYKPGPADGNPGRATRSAIIAYERDNGLAQTGRIDASLLAKLESATVN
jgi:localization factor PodJL